jgi:hypothetical protein
LSATLVRDSCVQGLHPIFGPPTHDLRRVLPEYF